MQQAIIWLIGLIFSIVLTALLTDPINYILARFFGGIIKHDRGIKGIWKAEYTFTSQGEPKKGTHFFLVKQFGKFVVAESLTNPKYPYKIKGKLDAKSFLTGTWSEKSTEHRAYHGAIQLTIAPQKSEMYGKWIGFNRKHEIMQGDWKWKLETLLTTKEEVKKYSNAPLS